MGAGQKKVPHGWLRTWRRCDKAWWLPFTGLRPEAFFPRDLAGKAQRLGVVNWSQNGENKCTSGRKATNHFTENAGGSKLRKVSRSQPKCKSPSQICVSTCSKATEQPKGAGPEHKPTRRCHYTDIKRLSPSTPPCTIRVKRIN